MASRVGQQLGNYRLISLLGEGGFAEVYLGEHIHLATQAAIKVLHTQLTSDDMEQFRAEARTIAHLEHSHIVRILDFGVEDKIPFLVMSYAPNGTLRQRHPKGMLLPLTTIVTYVKQIADALQYAHDEKLIHRDVKPENMLLGRHLEVLLSDFGIATLAQSSRYQSTQDVIGTVAYMAPEQIQGKPRPASDQYSLGVVIYEWLSGSRPFHGSFTELCTQHMFAPPPSLQEKNLGIPSEVEQVVQTALAKEPKERFPNVQALANSLDQAYQAIQPFPSDRILPTNQSFPPIQTPPSSTNQTFPPTVLAPLPALNQPLPPTQLAPPSIPSTNSFEMVTSPKRPFQPTELAIQPKLIQQLPFTATIESRLQRHKRGISRRTVVMGLIGLAAVTVGGGITWKVISSQKPPVGTTLLTYSGHSGGVNAVAWSPDGKRIASGSGEDETVQIWDATSGSHIFTYPLYSHLGSKAAWSPDGRRIATGEISGIHVWEPATGKNIVVKPNANAPLAWSPDGRHIASVSAISSAFNNNTVEVWDTATGSTVLSYHGNTNSISALEWSPDGTRIASGGLDKMVQIWNSTTGNTLLSYHGHSQFIETIAWSPDNKRIVSFGDDFKTHVWDASTGHDIWVSSNLYPPLQWSPDGSRIACGGSYKNVNIVEAATSHLIYAYNSYIHDAHSISDLAWSPDGMRIVTADLDEAVVRVWQAA